MKNRVTTYVIAGGLLGLFVEGVMTGVIAGAVTLSQYAMEKLQKIAGRKVHICAPFFVQFTIAARTTASCGLNSPSQPERRRVGGLIHRRNQNDGKLET
ncbi:hypothetical protein [Salinicoccus sp. RF5]|uniref:hypothetical protein n=1 Tax=Salinicoccus sp. RF5 TaxID=2748874 RepID=UPI001E62B10F|nr:hypothetical protein [Salinicoccus sp. RF5]MCC4722534.1 hypothetical protein [Salinicoccus sp. RF5]